MKTKNDILCQVAQKYGVSVQEVRAEIDAVIREAMSNPDPAIQAHWAAMSRSDGKVPTAEDVIAYCANQITMEQQSNALNPKA